MYNHKDCIMTMTPTPTFDQEKLNQFMGKVLSDFGGAASAVLAYIDGKVYVPEQGWVGGKRTGGSDEMFEKGPDGDGKIPPGCRHGGCKPLNDSPPY